MNELRKELTASIDERFNGKDEKLHLTNIADAINNRLAQNPV